MSTRLDSLQNFNTRMGERGRDATTTTAIEPPYQYDRTELDIFFTNAFPIRRACEAPTNHALRKWGRLTVNTEEDQHLVKSVQQKLSGSRIGIPNKREKGINARAYFRQAQIAAETYGGAGIVMLIDDGNMHRFEQPVNVNNIKSVRGLRVFDAWELQPDLWRTRDGKLEPDYYYLGNSQLLGANGKPIRGNQRIHASRVLPFIGPELTPSQADWIGLGWNGDSRVRQCIDATKHYLSAHQAIAHALQSFEVTTVSISGLLEKIESQDNYQDILRQRLEAVLRAYSIFGLLVTDKEEEEVNQTTRQFQGTDSAIERLEKYLVAATNLPRFILFREYGSQLGQMGEHEQSDFYMLINEYQQKMQEQIETLVTYILLSSEFASEGTLPDEYGWEWTPPREETSQEKADLRKTDAETYKTYIDTGVLKPETVRSSVFGGSEYSSEINLEEEESNSSSNTNAPDASEETQESPNENTSTIPEDALYVPKQNQDNTNEPSLIPPKGVMKEAERALTWAEKYPNDIQGYNHVGAVAATNLSNGHPCSLSWIRKLADWHEQHEGKEKSHPSLKRTPWKDHGRVAYALRGGDAGKRWAYKIVRQYRTDIIEYNSDRGKWLLLSKDRSQILGEHDSKQEAIKQEYAIEQSQQQRNDDSTPAKRILKLPNGLEIGIQYEAGDSRHGRALPYAYGHIRKTRGEDKMALDCYIGDAEYKPHRIYEVTQLDLETGEFDEYKYMIGFSSKDDAESAYKSCMPKDAFGGVRKVELSRIREYRSDSFDDLNAQQKKQLNRLLYNVGQEGRYTHAQADLQATPYEDGKQCFNCAFYPKDAHESGSVGGCALVDGPIAGNDWCHYGIFPKRWLKPSKSDAREQLIHTLTANGWQRDRVDSLTDNELKILNQEVSRNDDRACKQGMSCGNTCISPSYDCELVMGNAEKELESSIRSELTGNKPGETATEASERWAEDPLEIGKRASNIFKNLKGKTEVIQTKVVTSSTVQQSKEKLKSLSQQPSFDAFRSRMREPMSALREGISDLPGDVKLLAAQSVGKTLTGDSSIGGIAGALANNAPDKAKAFTEAVQQGNFVKAISTLDDFSTPLKKKAVSTMIKNSVKTVAGSTTTGALATAGADVAADFYSHLKQKAKAQQGSQTVQGNTSATKQRGRGLKQLANSLRPKQALSSLRGETSKALMKSVEKQGLYLLAGFGTNALFNAGDATIGLGSLPSFNIGELLASGSYEQAASQVLAGATAGAIGTAASALIERQRQRNRNASP